MIRHSLGGAVISFSLQHLIAPALELLPCLQALGTRDCNEVLQRKQNYCPDTNVWHKDLMACPCRLTCLTDLKTSRLEVFE